MASSSDEETSTGHWREHLRTRTQLLSADQLELWRKVLREEIEEDLQRQVRDRLGLDWLCPPVPVAVEDSQCILSLRSSRPQAQPTPDKPNPLPTVTVQPTDLMRETNSSNHRVHAMKKKHSTKHHIPTVQPARPSHVTGHVIDQVSLEQYVHSKYGVPEDQLSLLQCNGVLQTRTLDTSGCGKGPMIHVPTEAYIHHPTPVHVNTAGHVTSSPGHVTASPGHVTTANGHVTTTNGHVTQSYEYTEDTVPIKSPSRPHGAHHPHKSHTVRSHAPQEPHNIPSQDHALHSPHSQDGSLTFEAEFESGNLHRAEQIGAFEYKLSLNFDLYSNKYTQWFYFRIQGMVAMTTYVFHIVNLYKPDSLYNYGMQPLLYSQCEAELGKEGWSRVGRDVQYGRTPSTKYFTLSWSMEFPHTGDLCYLAHCYPYPYSRLLTVLDSLNSECVHRESLCKTLAGNDCPLVTITDFGGSEIEMADREGVVITARVHPGETNSSWMMEGLLHMLSSDTAHAKALRSVYVFKLVPMLNPDGVVVGNYRSSLAGVDLNRVYKNTASELFPTVAATKAMMDTLMTDRKVVLYVDLHGHSRKQNVFMYGCHAPQCDHTHFLKERLFPFILSQQAPQMFSFASCKYAVQRCKESTGRVVMWRRGVPNSFTMEATFCGSTLGHHAQFTAEDLMEMGRQLGEAVYRHHRLTISRSTEQRVLGQLAEVIMQSALPDVVPTHTTEDKRKTARRALRRFMKFDLDQIHESSTSGSDSENDEFEYKRKKVSKTRRARHRSTLHTRTQPLLPSLASHPLTQASHPPHGPPAPHLSHRRKSIPVTRSCAPLPSLALSAPPRLEGKGQSWKFVDKYKGRSNGGIPMFSEERSRERAEKRLHSVSMFQQSTGRDDSKSDGEKSRRKFPMYWQHSIGQDLALARAKGTVESTVTKQPPPKQDRSRESMVARQLNVVHERQWMHELRSQLSEQRSKGQLSPALAQFIKDLWSKH